MLNIWNLFLTALLTANNLDTSSGFSIIKSEPLPQGWPTNSFDVPPSDLYDCLFLFFVCTEKASGSWPNNKARCTKIFNICQTKLEQTTTASSTDDVNLGFTSVTDNIVPVSQPNEEVSLSTTDAPGPVLVTESTLAPTPALSSTSTSAPDEQANVPTPNPDGSQGQTVVGEEDTGPDKFPVDLLIQSCYDLLVNGSKATGIYPLQIGPSRKEVFCDMQSLGGGWTVIQRRGNFPTGSNPKDYFLRNWTNYQNGFGAANNELWLGLESIFYLTNKEPSQLLITLEDFEGNRVGLFVNDFRITNERGGYRIFYTSFSSDLGKSLPARGTKYSTIDRDNDAWSKNCAERFSGAWWYSACHNSNLNGLYLKGEHASFGDGVNWYHWKGYHYSLKSTVMKIRPQRLAPVSTTTTTTITSTTTTTTTTSDTSTTASDIPTTIPDNVS